ncbi:histidine-containing phosphotransfer protein 2-like [Cynara cardunculus var. scolymus]|uniref:histidine-containing phosphotransfer protein 2-like n=1 Tax=Cynara cardunculus var. scolymus TaxID=59895 RepID=UPI000D623454|nr:histidine-containing phosphotransfer protein 2-like [Cynara cardunculus var. scolymus]
MVYLDHNSCDLPDNDGRKFSGEIPSDVDHRFDKFKVYQSVEKADELRKQVEVFCLEVDREISELESYSKRAKINFLEATKIARSIKARSIWMGAQNVKKAAFFVIDACLGFHEESYSSAVYGLRNDFNGTKVKFETYLKMVFELIEKENQQKEQKQEKLQKPNQAL